MLIQTNLLEYSRTLTVPYAFRSIFEAETSRTLSVNRVFRPLIDPNQVSKETKC